jgi:hypothetical protein
MSTFLKVTLTWMAVLPALALADHWIGPKEVMRAAHRVDNRAQTFSEIAKAVAGMDPFTKDSRRLARDADQLHAKIERGASYQQVEAEYRQLQASFQRMSDQFDKNHLTVSDWRVRYYWFRVAYSFHELDWAMTQGKGAIDLGIDPDAEEDDRPHRPRPHGPRP